MAKKKATRKRASKKSSRTSSVNMSAEIKSILLASPDKKPAEIVEELAVRGLKTNTGYVSNIKTNMKAQGKKQSATQKKKAVRKPMKKVSRTKRVAAAEPSEVITHDQLLQVKKLAQELGGVEKTQQLLKALAELAE